MAGASPDPDERLRQSEEMHRLTLELTQQIVWTTEADGSGLVMSERYREITGVGSEEAELSIHPDERDEVLERWGMALQSGMPFDVECRLRMKDGSYRFFHIRGVPLRDEQGRILRWYGITADVDEQKQAEINRLDMAERHRLAAQATNDAIWDHDFTSETIDWSDNAAAILGVAQPRLGRTPASWWEERIHPDEKLSLLQSLSDAISGKNRRWSGTYRFRRDDGSYADVLDRGFIIRDANGRAIRAVGAISDVTERHRAEAEVRRMQAELIHVSRLSAMGAMASTLAHELNQPLAAVTNFVSGAKRIAENPRGAAGGACRSARRGGDRRAPGAGDLAPHPRPGLARQGGGARRAFPAADRRSLRARLHRRRGARHPPPARSRSGRANGSAPTGSRSSRC